MAESSERSTTKLLVKNLPAELSDDDKRDLFKCFGAKNVFCFGKKGKMVSNGCVFMQMVFMQGVRIAQW